jgi:hypothetical protein
LQPIKGYAVGKVCLQSKVEGRAKHIVFVDKEAHDRLHHHSQEQTALGPASACLGKHKQQLLRHARVGSACVRDIAFVLLAAVATLLDNRLAPCGCNRSGCSSIDSYLIDFRPNRFHF